MERVFGATKALSRYMSWIAGTALAFLMLLTVCDDRRQLALHPVALIAQRLGGGRTVLLLRRQGSDRSTPGGELRVLRRDLGRGCRQRLLDLRGPLGELMCASTFGVQLLATLDERALGGFHTLFMFGTCAAE